MRRCKLGAALWAWRCACATALFQVKLLVQPSARGGCQQGLVRLINNIQNGFELDHFCSALV